MSAVLGRRGRWLHVGDEGPARAVRRVSGHVVQAWRTRVELGMSGE